MKSIIEDYEPNLEWSLLFLLRNFPYILAFRISNALLSNTFHDPDEYYQASEIAHAYVYNYGFTSWEFNLSTPIRSFLFPSCLSYGYKILSALGYEDSLLFIYFPKLIMAFLLTLIDCYTFMLADKFFGRGPARWALFSSLTSWFTLFCGVRPYTNNLETLFNLIGLYHWPWPTLYRDQLDRRLGDIILALIPAAIACIFRPTSAIIWVYVVVDLLLRAKLKVWAKVIPTGFFILSISLLISANIDREYYKIWTFVPWNFFKFNIVNKISLFYGTHPWHWYVTQGFPLIAFSHLPFALSGILSGAYIIVRKQKKLFQARLIDNSLIYVLLFGVLVYSLIPHKEFRFIFPFLPIIMVYSGCALNNIHQPLPPVDKEEIKLTAQKASRNIKLSVLFLIISNLLLGWYFSMVHQRGVIDVMWWVRKNVREVGDKKVDGVLILMPCHSTPLHSFVHHKDVYMRFLTCEPPIGTKGIGLNGKYLDEADVFYLDPIKFMDTYFEKEDGNANVSINATSLIPVPGQKYAIKSFRWESHLILFEALEKVVGDYLRKKGYNECARFFNTHWHDDRRRGGDVLVYCRKKEKI